MYLGIIAVVTGIAVLAPLSISTLEIQVMAFISPIVITVLVASICVAAAVKFYSSNNSVLVAPAVAVIAIRE